MASVSAHVAHTLSAHVDHVFGVMGNGNEQASGADINVDRLLVRP